MYNVHAVDCAIALRVFNFPLQYRLKLESLVRLLSFVDKHCFQPANMPWWFSGQSMNQPAKQLHLLAMQHRI